MNGFNPLVCVMGVSAAGKSSFGRALADALALPFLDADDLHSEINRAKMASGIPLTDEDRWPWLDAVGGSFRSHRTSGLVMACSALRLAYRDRIRAIVPAVLFVHLVGSPELLSARAEARTDHFMPPQLLASQIATLEPLTKGEAGIVVDVTDSIDAIVAAVAKKIRAPAT